MRTIPHSVVIFFSILGNTILAFAFLCSVICYRSLETDFRPLLSVLTFVVVTYSLAFLAYRIFLYFRPIMEGDQIPGSRSEFAFQVHNLFFLVFFNLLTRTNIVPVPLSAVLFRALGAKIGKNSFLAGPLLDPPLVSIGNNSIVGHLAVIYCHAIEGQSLSMDRVKIGSNVTLGAFAIVMGGVEIGDNSIVASGAVVSKGTKIPSGQIWGGVPARFLKNVNESAILKIV